MDFISHLFQSRPVAPPEIQDTRAPESSTTGAICNFFTENVNYLITASLVYFVLFSGVARMKSRHLMVAVPAAAIWTVYQAKAWVVTLAAGTTLLGLARAFFTWQSTGGQTHAGEGLANMAQRFTPDVGGAQEMASAVATQALQNQPKASSPLQGVANSVMEQVSSRQTASSPALTPERTTSLFGDTDQAVEAFEAFSEQRASYQQLLPFGEELDLDFMGTSSPEFEQYLDATFGEMSEFPEAFELSNAQKLERIWAEASSQPLSPDIDMSLGELWQQGLEQAPQGANTEDWAAEFLVREGKKKGMSFGQVAKWCIGLALAGLTVWGLYKVWCASCEEADREDEVHELDLESDYEFEGSPESGWLGYFGSALSCLAPDSDGYDDSYSDGMHMLGDGMAILDRRY